MRTCLITALLSLLLLAGCVTYYEHWEIGQDAWEHGNYDHAVQELTQAIRMDPDRKDAYEIRGLAYLQLGKQELADADFAKALKLGGFKPPYEGFGDVDQGRGEYSKSIQDYTQALKYFPNDGELFYKRGCAYFLAGKQAEATADFAKYRAPDGRSAYLRKAQELYDAKKYPAAYPFYAKVVETQKTNADLWFREAYCRYLAGDLPGAIGDMRTSVKLNPDFRAAVLDLAFFLRYSGSSAEAIDWFTTLAKRDPKDWAALYERGQCRREMGDLTGAIADAQAASAVDPTQGEPLLMVAYIRWKRGDDPKQVEESLLKAMIADPDIGLKTEERDFSALAAWDDFHRIRGDALLTHYEHRWGHAQDAYKQALKMNPSNAAACWGLAQYYDGLGILGYASENTLKAMDLDPVTYVTAAAFERLSKYTLAGGHVEEALAYYLDMLDIDAQRSNMSYLKSIVEKDPDLNNGILAYNSAIGKQRNNDSAGAIAEYTRVIDLIPDWGTARYHRGGLKYALKDTAGARADYSEAIARNPRDPRFYWARAMLDAHNHEPATAIEDFTRYIRFRPEDYNGYYERARCCMDTHQYESAIADFGAAAPRAAKSKATSMVRVSIFADSSNARLKLEDTDGALADAQSAMEVDSDSIEALNARGMAYYGAERYEEAIADFTRSIQNFADQEQPYTYRGWSRYAQRDYTGALADFEAGFANNPFALRGLEGIAVSAARLKKTDKSLDALEQLLTYDPSAADWAMSVDALSILKSIPRFTKLIKDALQRASKGE